VDVPENAETDIKNESARMARSRKGTSSRAKAIETYEFIGDLFTNCIRRFDPKTMIATTVTLAINLE
jgi:hypothetical protein